MSVSLKTLTRASVPADLRDSYDFVVNVEGIATTAARQDLRLLVRRSTLGEAVELVSGSHPNLKIEIRMPVPRQPPWTELAALVLAPRPAPTTLLVLDGVDRANLLELLRACGAGNDGVEPFNLVARTGWVLHPLVEQLERSKAPTEEPTFSAEELADDVGDWLKRRLRQSTAAPEASEERCPQCGSSDVVVENGFRGCKSCGKATPLHEGLVP